VCNRFFFVLAAQNNFPKHNLAIDVNLVELIAQIVLVCARAKKRHAVTGCHAYVAEDMLSYGVDV